MQDDDNDLRNAFLGSKIILVKSKFFRIFFFRFLLEQFYIPFLCCKYRINILHSLHYSFPIFLFKVNAARKSKVDDNTAKMQSIKQLGV